MHLCLTFALIASTSKRNCTFQCFTITFQGKNQTNDLFNETKRLGKGVFEQIPGDNNPAMSVEDKAFLKIMDRGAFMDDLKKARHEGTYGYFYAEDL